MKKIIFISAVFFSLFLILSCESITTYTTPFIYTNNSSTDFEILGEILLESRSRIGYVELLRAAKRQYSDCDYVIDIMMDQRTTTTTTSYIIPFVPNKTVNDTLWIMRGTAIRYKNTANFSDIDTGSAVNRQDYTVVRVSGLVQHSSEGTWVNVNAGDILSRDTLIRTAFDSSLVLTDGNSSITIPAGVFNRIEDLIINLNN